MHPRSLILATAALTMFGASASAQSQSGKVFARYNKPLKSRTLDLATGTITRGPAVNNRAATTVVDFNNNDLGGFVGVDTGNGFCEWFDAAVKGQAGNGSDLMNDVVFAFCSAMLFVNSGGPGGSVKLGFYEGYTIFGGAPSTPVAVFTLTGLPANTASSSFFGGFNCYFIRIIFGTLVSFADGPIGYSWKFIDVGTDGTLAGTWPFLSCVVSCSGAILQVDGQGMTDAIDEYCPPGTLRATFTFGTVSGSFTSMSMDVREVQDVMGSETAYNAAIDANPDLLSVWWPAPPEPQWATINRLYGGGVDPNPPFGVIGYYLDLIPDRAPGPGTFSVVVRANRIAAPNGVYAGPPFAPGPGSRLLISGSTFATQAGTHNGQRGTTPAQLIPPSFGLVCVHFASQAVVLAGGGPKLSSAVEGTIGAQ